MGKLSHIKAQLEGKTGNEALIEVLFQGLFDSVQSSSSKMSGGIQKKLNELQRVVGAFGSDVNKNSDASLTKIIGGLNEVVAAISKGQNEANQKFKERISALEKIVAANHKSSSKALQRSVSDVLGGFEKSISAIPQTDLGPVNEAILQIAKIDIPQTDLEPLTRLLERPKEWEFEFTYKKFGGGIDKVLATEVT